MKYSNYDIIKKVLSVAKPYWKHLLGIFMLTFLSTPLALLKPLALKILIDSGFGQTPLPGFITFFFPGNYAFSFFTIILIAVVLVVLTALLNNIYSMILWMASTFTGQKMVLSFRSIIFNHVQRLSLAYHDTKGTSDSLYRIQYDSIAIRNFLIDSFSSMLSSFLTLLAMILVMFYINWRFAVIALSVIPPLIFIMRISTKKLRSGWVQVKNSESQAMSVVHEALNSLRVVKAFSQEEEEERKFVSKANEAVKGEVKVAMTASVFDLLVGFIFAVATALFIYYGALLVHDGKMTIGELTIIIAYLTQFFSPLEKISKNINSIQSSLTSLGRVFTILENEKEVRESAEPIDINSFTGSFEFNNVSFNYGSGHPVLKNVSFKISPGDRVGIMGSTGAGKSTLINLLTRFYDPSSGVIQANGKDIRNYRLNDYRMQFGIVLQDALLFSTSIEENIAYGKIGANKKEIVEAAKMANAHEFIMRSQNGYETLVGQRGMQLSGGERQRISLARAFIKNAPVLIMDEPTSSVDVKTESLIMEAMERLMEGRTTFLITHRLDTLKACNVILYMEHGMLKEVINNADAEQFERKKKEWVQVFFNA
jgi:ATP-binding cassette subfamily B protein